MHEAWLAVWVSNRMAIVSDASLQTLPCALAPSVLPWGFPDTKNQLILHHLETLWRKLRKMTFLKRRLLQVRIYIDISVYGKKYENWSFLDSFSFFFFLGIFGGFFAFFFYFLHFHFELAISSYTFLSVTYWLSSAVDKVNLQVCHKRKRRKNTTKGHIQYKQSHCSLIPQLCQIQVSDNCPQFAMTK